MSGCPPPKRTKADLPSGAAATPTRGRYPPLSGRDARAAERARQEQLKGCRVTSALWLQCRLHPKKEARVCLLACISEQCKAVGTTPTTLTLSLALRGTRSVELKGRRLGLVQILLLTKPLASSLPSQVPLPHQLLTLPQAFH